MPATYSKPKSSSFCPSLFPSISASDGRVIWPKSLFSIVPHDNCSKNSHQATHSHAYTPHTEQILRQLFRSTNVTILLPHAHLGTSPLLAVSEQVVVAFSTAAEFPVIVPFFHRYIPSSVQDRPL